MNEIGLMRRWRVRRALRDLDTYGPDEAQWPSRARVRIASVRDTPDVRDALALLELVASTLHADTPEPAADLRERVLASIAAQPAALTSAEPKTHRPISRSISWRKLLLPSGAVAAAALIGVTFGYAAPSEPTPEAEFLSLMGEITQQAGFL